jgi:predicted metal-dependent hydrolase
MATASTAGDEERALLADARFHAAVALFNQGEWYACHDGFEALWHETQGPMRPVLQGILQIAVAHLHLERGNLRGAVMLLGEGLGRLASTGPEALGLSLDPLRLACSQRLQALQTLAAGAAAADPSSFPPPRLEPVEAAPVH